jgi:hypothetical protein
MTGNFRVSCALYKMVLLTYPRNFRLRFGGEMVTAFSDQMCGEWEHTGLPGVVRVWRRALAEVFFVAVPLQLQNPIVITASLALLSSLAFFMAVFYAMTHVCNGE